MRFLGKFPFLVCGGVNCFNSLIVILKDTSFPIECLHFSPGQLFCFHGGGGVEWAGSGQQNTICRSQAPLAHSIVIAMGAGDCEGVELWPLQTLASRLKEPLAQMSHRLSVS